MCLLLSLVTVYKYVHMFVCLCVHCFPLFDVLIEDCPFEACIVILNSISLLTHGALACFSFELENEHTFRA